MFYNILIAEDDVFISEHLKHIITEMGHNVCGIVDNENRAIEFLEKNKKPNLALLDIQMHGKDQGVLIAKRLNSLEVPFVFVTSFSDKNTLKSAVREKPVGYIVKPFSDQEIIDCISEILNDLELDFITIKHNKELRKIYVRDIIYIMSSNVYVEIFTTNNRYVCRLKLTEIQNELSDEKFIKVHRSYLVNKDYIQSLSKNNMEVGGFTIPISKNNRDLVESILKSY